MDIFDKVFEESKKINSKAKGNSNEVDAANFMTRWTGENFCRVPSSGGIHSESPWFAGDICPARLGFLIEFNTVIETKHWNNFGKFGGKRFGNLVESFWRQNLRDVIRLRSKDPFFANCKGMLLLRVNRMTVGEYWVVVTENSYNKKLPSIYSLDKFSLVMFRSCKILNYDYRKII